MIEDERRQDYQWKDKRRQDYQWIEDKRRREYQWKKRLMKTRLSMER